MQRLTKAVIQKTLQLSIFIAAGLLLYGDLIGTLLDGGALAGYLIRLLAPVVPFVYLEIVLEALLKGMGQQSFSSLNYLAEYTIRIAIVLVCIPKFAFTESCSPTMPAMFAETVSASGKPVKLPVFAFRSGVMSDFRCLQ